MLADELDYLVGVDTHRDQHAVAIVDAHTGALLAQTTTAASARGYADAVRFAGRHAPGGRLWAIEGAGDYGAGLVRHLQRQGEQVHEVDHTSRAERRLHGKNDQLESSPCRPLRARRRASGEAERRRASGGAAAAVAGEANGGRHARETLGAFTWSSRSRSCSQRWR